MSYCREVSFTPNPKLINLDASSSTLNAVLRFLGTIMTDVPSIQTWQLIFSSELLITKFSRFALLDSSNKPDLREKVSASESMVSQMSLLHSIFSSRLTDSPLP